MTYPSREQQLILFCIALLLTVTYFIHRPFLLGFYEDLTLYKEKDCSYIEVSGEVNSPGIYCFKEGITVSDALKMAGSVKGGLIIDEAFRSMQLKNGEKLLLKKVSERMAEVFIERMEPQKLVVLSVPIDLNEATEEELLAVPEMGPKTSLRIIQYREEKGRFSTLSELKNVKGIGNATYKKIKKYFIIKGGESS